MAHLEPCRVDGCGRRVRRLGLCFGHLHRGAEAEVAPRSPGLARDAEGRKRCSACKQWLAVEQFTKDHRSKDGRRALCLDCHRSRRRTAKFGVSADWFAQTFAAQGSCCAVCRSPEPRGRGWAIDHDHSCCPDKGSSCGACVRGILCSPCNFALGLFGDRAEVLGSAVGYLNAHRKPAMSIVRGV